MGWVSGSFLWVGSLTRAGEYLGGVKRNVKPETYSKNNLLCVGMCIFLYTCVGCIYVDVWFWKPEDTSSVGHYLPVFLV